MLLGKPVLVKPSLSMAFAPDKWNRPDVVRESNCMAYALNRQDLGLVWLYGGSFNPEHLLKDAPSLRALWNNTLNLSGEQRASELALQFQGLERIQKHTGDPSKHHIIAFTGGHFYRMDGDRTWSNKSGGGHATNRDVRGHIILNPDTLHTQERPYTKDDYSMDTDTLRALSEIIHSASSDETTKQRAQQSYNVIRAKMGSDRSNNTVSYFRLRNSGMHLSPRYKNDQSQLILEAA